MLINPLFLLTGGVGIAMHTKTPLPSTSRLRVPEADLDQVIQVIQDSSLPTSILVTVTCQVVFNVLYLSKEGEGGS